MSPTFHVVLVEPEIPPNTGNIGRLCVAAGAALHLIRPFGFTLDDKNLRRAGLDYWPNLDLHTWDSLADLQAAMAAQTPLPRYFYLTTKTDRPYDTRNFQPGDFLVFGRETKGLPESLLAAHPDSLLTIPMRPGVRSLNLATAVAIVLFEGMRQTREGNSHALP